MRKIFTGLFGSCSEQPRYSQAHLKVRAAQLPELLRRGAFSLLVAARILHVFHDGCDYLVSGVLDLQSGWSITLLV